MIERNENFYAIHIHTLSLSLSHILSPSFSHFPLSFSLSFSLCVPADVILNPSPVCLTDDDVVKEVKAARAKREDFETIKIIGRGAFGEVCSKGKALLCPFPLLPRNDINRLCQI